MIILYNSPSDEELGNKVSSDLKQSGEPIWFPGVEDSSGDNLETEKEKALKDAHTFLFIASKKSVASTDLLDKLKNSIAANKLVILLYAEACSFPFAVSKLEGIDLSENYYNGLTVLRNVLQFQDEDAK